MTYTTTNANINSADYRLTQRPARPVCDVCKVNVACYRSFDSATNETKNVCRECMTKGAN